MPNVQFRKANCVDNTSTLVIWSGGSQDLNGLPDVFVLDDSHTDQLAAYDSCPWLYRAGGDTSAAAD